MILRFRRDGCVTRQPESREGIVIQRVAMTEDSLGRQSARSASLKGRRHCRAVGLGVGFALILGVARLGPLCCHGIFCKCRGGRHYEDGE